MSYAEVGDSTALRAPHAVTKKSLLSPSAEQVGGSPTVLFRLPVRNSASVVPEQGLTTAPDAPGGPALAVKHGVDRLVALLAVLVLSPLLLMLAAAVRFSSRGPALFRQTRVGRDGRPFTMLKFRSMQTGAESKLSELLTWNESAGGVLFKMRDDPRVTRVGRVLRRFSLDELPQLINVLNGTMSLVGPRPPLPSEVARYSEVARRRLMVKPGLTGLWQVGGRSDLSWEESLRLDLDYVERWSLRLDLIVLCKTVPAVLRADGAY